MTVRTLLMRFTDALLEILVAFGGRPGSAEATGDTVRFLLPAVFWAVLMVSALVNWRHSRKRREFFLALAFGVGLFRELYFFAILLAARLGWFKLAYLHLFFPPFEHALLMAADILLAYAFLRFVFGLDSLGRKYVLTGISTTIVLYLVTAFDWYRLSGAHPELKFGAYWGDMAYRILTAAALSVPLYLIIVKQRGRLVCQVLFAAFLFLFLDEALMIINLLYEEAYAAVFTPIRHNLHIWAVPLLGAVYYLEAKEELEKALGDSEAEKNKTAAVLGALGDLLSIQDTNFRILYQNQASKDIVGDHLGEFCYAAYEKRDTPCAHCPLQEMFKDGQRHRAEREVLIEGEKRYLDIKTSPLKNAQGEILAGIEIARDTTARYQMEAALKESEERYRNLVESSPDSIVVHVQGIARYVNPATLSLFGAEDARQFLGQSVINFIHPDYREVVIQRMRERHGDLLEEKFIRLNGEIIDVEVKSLPIIYQGQPAALVISRDITLRKQAEKNLLRIKEELEVRNEELQVQREELEKQNEELKALDKMKDGLVRDVTHELKTPVAKQKMQLEILKQLLDKQNLRESFQAVIATMESSIRRQENVIHNILDLSRLEAGGRKYKNEPVRLDQIIEAVLNDYQAMLLAHNFIVEKALPVVTITSDEEMLFHVFSNLVNNAIKYRSRKKQPRLELLLDAATDRIMVKVIDNGLGLTPSELENVFKRFYQASASSEGSGVGLTIVQLIVADFGGEIWLESSGLEQGVTVNLELPI